jgi:DNA-3-methyladenine glycosylase II
VSDTRGQQTSGILILYPVQDLAKHFAEGKLSADKLWSASDEELNESLIAVKGIGPVRVCQCPMHQRALTKVKWTVNMFSIFSLRRPDILPVGDLGTQRGLLRFILAQHTNPGSPIKLLTKAAPEDEVSSSQEVTDQLMDASADPVAAVGSMAPPPKTPTKKRKGADEGEMIPEPFTPSINRVLAAPVVPTPLPPGLTVATLRARLSGKNKIKLRLLHLSNIVLTRFLQRSISNATRDGTTDRVLEAISLSR